MSLLYYLFYVRCAGGIEPLISAKKGMGQEFKVKGGAYQICEKLREKLGSDRVKLCSPVTRIWQDGECVKVKTENGEIWTALRCILALPPNQTGMFHQ